jgi:hypothetical protein
VVGLRVGNTSEVVESPVVFDVKVDAGISKPKAY